LSLARANGIHANDVFEVNASKQSNRVSAFVTGIGGTERIVLNDNLLRRVSPQGIMAVMGHEMGHYVMHHILNSLLFLTILAAVFFLILKWALEYAIAHWGPSFRIRGISDSAVLPLALFIVLTLDFIATPIENTWTRTEESEADMYGLNAARQPDGEAEVDLLLGEYRKLDPGPLEEFVFYDHPSGRSRIYTAMRWKAENLLHAESLFHER
jgi:STE24 endopeptidase